MVAGVTTRADAGGGRAPGADRSRGRRPVGCAGERGGLGERHGVSRVTVRRALELLRAEGLVESRRGAGWFVAGASFHQPLALGTFRHAASAVTEAGLTASRRVVDFGFGAGPWSGFRRPRPRRGADVLHVRSVRSVDGVPLDVAHEWVPAATGGRGQPGGRAGARHLGHPAARRASASTGSARPSPLPWRPTTTPSCSTSPPARALLLVRRVAHDDQGTPVALADHRYLASRFSLEVEFRGWSDGRCRRATRTARHGAVRTYRRRLDQ